MSSQAVQARDGSPDSAPIAEIVDLLDLHQAQERSRGLLESARNACVARSLLPELRRLSEAHPKDRVLRSSVLHAREKAGESEGLDEAWEALATAYPDDLPILRSHLRRVVAAGRTDEAQDHLDTVFRRFPPEQSKALAKAEFLDDIRLIEPSEAVYRLLLETADSHEVRLSFAKRLRKRHLWADADEVLYPLKNRVREGTKARELVEEVAETHAFFSTFEGEADLRGQDFRILAMKHAVLSFCDRPLPEELTRGIRIALVTGGLGAGGAERQLTRMATHLHGQRDWMAAHIEQVDVIVKGHQDSAGFFLPDLTKAGVNVVEMNELTPVAAKNQPRAQGDLLRLLEMLPPQVHYGVTRLAPHLRARNVNVVSLWQDGTCLLGALAALLADVPVIQLVFRGLPPNIRTSRMKPEYEVIYRALARVPGVQFICNSKVAAGEYAAWLGIPEKEFVILYNGVPPMDAAGDPADVALWAAFAERTQGATETIGGVFRLEPVKQPLTWIRMAKRYLQRRPGARFVVVGGGRMEPAARLAVADAGLEDRFLFVGHSGSVGYWYLKMDVKVLLSRFEGLPNVLIEAQSLGVPVVSTPAGGAAECVFEGETGYILGSAETPCLDEACDRIEALLSRPGLAADNRLRAVEFVASRFAVDPIIDRFVECCAPTSAVVG